MLHAVLHARARSRRRGGEACSVVLPSLYLAAIALPLLLTVVAVGARLAAFVGTRIDAVVAREPDAPPAPVTPLPVAHELASLPQVVEPVGEPPAPPAVRPGPLQLVDDAEPTTKRCPDCAETVLASARVCKHCHFRFAPPLQGSWAV